MDHLDDNSDASGILFRGATGDLNNGQFTIEVDQARVRLGAAPEMANDPVQLMQHFTANTVYDSNLYECSNVRVIDGDTVAVTIGLPFHISLSDERLRLWGIDTPEIYGTKRKDAEQYVRGMQAKAHLEQRVTSAETLYLQSLKIDFEDQYGRYLAILWADIPKIGPNGEAGPVSRINLNQELVNLGHAVPYMID